MGRLRRASPLSTDLRYQLQFILWVVLLGPIAYLAAIQKALGSTADWSTLLHYYGMAFTHFLWFATLISAIAMLWRNKIERWTRLSLGLRSAVVLAFAMVALLCAWGTMVLFGHGRDLSPMLMHGTEDLMIALVIVGVEKLHHNMVSSRFEAERHLLENERALRTAAEARWSSLESRIRPHFLFNTLTSIRELMHRDVSAADTMVQRFADLLRFSLDSERRSVVSLQEELAIVVDYLEVEQMRLGPRLRWELHVDPECHSLTIPALTVLTLVENSLKHAIAPRRSGGCVTVNALFGDWKLNLEVKDDGPGFSDKDIVAGHGLDLLLRHLENWNSDARMDVIELDCGVSVRITIPFREGTECSPAAVSARREGVPA